MNKKEKETEKFKDDLYTLVDNAVYNKYILNTDIIKELEVSKLSAITEFMCDNLEDYKKARIEELEHDKKKAKKKLKNEINNLKNEINNLKKKNTKLNKKKVNKKKLENIKKKVNKKKVNKKKVKNLKKDSKL